jgi:hypothetical protein
MNYLKIYHDLIDRAKNRKINGYYETHHIKPRCMGGLDNPDNLCALTAEEHYVAHQLLLKIYPNEQKLAYAAFMMTVSSSTTVRNNKLYGWVKKKRFAEPMPDETRKKISLKLTGRIGHSHSEETKAKMRGPNPTKGNPGEKNGFYGKTHSPETLMHLANVCGAVHKGVKKTEEHKQKLKDSFTDERRIELSARRAETNKNASEEWKDATRKSNIERGIKRQKQKILTNLSQYELMFDAINQGKTCSEISKELNILYRTVWETTSNYDYYYQIYMDVKKEASSNVKNSLS